MDDDIRSQLHALTLRTQADVQRMWELLMRPLGFRGLSVWLTLVGPDRRPIRFLVEVDDLPPAPTDEDADCLFAMLADLVRDGGDACSVALLVTRPGGHGLTDLDRQRAAMFLRAARRHSVPCEPIHVATDVAVLAVTPDDLAA